MALESETAAKLLLGLVEIARDERKVVQDAKESLGVVLGRRIDARISFSSIEAVTYALKQLSLAYESEASNPQIRPEELLALQDLQVDVDKQGKISTKAGKFGLYGGIRLALNSVTVKRGFPPRDINFGSPGGQAFGRSVALRDRLTHPKSISDYEVTAAESDDITAALIWYGQHVVYALTGNWNPPSVPNVYGSQPTHEGNGSQPVIDR